MRKLLLTLASLGLFTILGCAEETAAPTPDATPAPAEAPAPKAAGAKTPMTGDVSPPTVVKD